MAYPCKMLNPDVRGHIWLTSYRKVHNTDESGDQGVASKQGVASNSCDLAQFDAKSRVSRPDYR